MRKTVTGGKRITARATLVVLGSTIIYAIIPDDIELIKARGEIVSIIVWPILAFAASLLGIDWAGKNTDFLQKTPRPHYPVDDVKHKDEPDY